MELEVDGEQRFETMKIKDLKSLEISLVLGPYFCCGIGFPFYLEEGCLRKSTFSEMDIETIDNLLLSHYQTVGD